MAVASAGGSAAARPPAPERPRVTVVLSTYNWSSVLPFSIASVLDQTFPDFDLLVIGDGCTDDSGDVVGQIADPRVHWHNLSRNTRHQSGPNNEGIRRARGEVVAYLGHDDLWLPNHLEVLLSAIDGGASVAHATTLGVAPDKCPSLYPPSGWVFRPGEWIPPTSVGHLRQLTESVGDWRMPGDTGRLDPESELWARMAAIGASPQWIPRVTSVKLFAALRPGVYRERPHHEQEYWLHRIREAQDPEASMHLAASTSGLYSAIGDRTQRLIRAVASRTRVRTRLVNRGIIRPPRDQTAEGRWSAGRRFKGLDG